jgi:hypothetical protein
MYQALGGTNRIVVDDTLDPATQRSTTKRDARDGKVGILDPVGFHSSISMDTDQRGATGFSASRTLQ